MLGIGAVADQPVIHLVHYHGLHYRAGFANGDRAPYAPTPAARGVATIVGVPYLELLTRMSKGVAAIVEECEEHGTDEAKHWLNYVLHEAAAHHEGLQEDGTVEEGRVGPRGVARLLEALEVRPPGCGAASGMASHDVPSGSQAARRVWTLRCVSLCRD